MGRGSYLGGSSIWGPSDFSTWSSSQFQFKSNMKGGMEQDPFAHKKEKEKEIEYYKSKSEDRKKARIAKMRQLRKNARERRQKEEAEKLNFLESLKTVQSTGCAVVAPDGKLSWYPRSEAVSVSCSAPLPALVPPDRTKREPPVQPQGRFRK